MAHTAQVRGQLELDPIVGHQELTRSQGRRGSPSVLAKQLTGYRGVAVTPSPQAR